MKKYRITQVEWYAGNSRFSRPQRVKVNGIWEDVFQCEKKIVEDVHTKKRRTIFLCHIGDNRIVEICDESPVDNI